MNMPERFWPLNDRVSNRDAFGRALFSGASEYPHLVLCDADVAGGTGAKDFVKTHPDRVFQFGIAEQNMMAAAAGMAEVGLMPIVSTFSAFGTMRAHEQFRTAIAYANRNVKLCCSHVGLDVGPDGATAQMLEDLATVRAIPNTCVLVPADANQLLQAFSAMLMRDGPCYMRTGRSDNPVVTPHDQPFAIGKANRLREGCDVAIIACGVMVARALMAADKLEGQGVRCRVINMASLKPIDTQEIISAAKETKGIVTAEDHSVIGGLGSAVAEVVCNDFPTRVIRVGVDDVFGGSGDPEALAKAYGIDSDAIALAAMEVVKS